MLTYIVATMLAVIAVPPEMVCIDTNTPSQVVTQPKSTKFDCLKACDAHVSQRYNYINDRDGLYACITECGAAVKEASLVKTTKPLPSAKGFYKMVVIVIGLILLAGAGIALYAKVHAHPKIYKTPTRWDANIESKPRRAYEVQQRILERRELVKQLCRRSSKC